MLLIAAAALGYTVGIPWLDNLFGNAANGLDALAAANGGAGGADGRVGDEATAPNGSCFLGLICLYTNADLDGNNVNVSVDSEGVNANSN